jgi:hypothetical protein
VAEALVSHLLACLLCATCVLYKHQATSSLNSRVGKNNFAIIILPVFPNFLIVVTASREKTGRWFMQEFALSPTGE